MRFAILGIGQTGQAMACYLMNQGHMVTLWDRKPEKVDLISQKGITCEGTVAGHYRPAAEASIGAAVAGADYIFVMTVAKGHAPIAELLAGQLVEHQRIVIFNGNWGAVTFEGILGDELRAKGVILAETGGMILLASSPETGRCRLNQVKNTMNIGAVPADGAAVIAAELAEILPGLEPAQNVLDTSINSSNPVLHVPITLFNIARVENGEDYSFYGDAATRLTVRFAECCDAERMQLAEAVGIRGQRCVDIINSFWDDQYDTLYDALKNNADYLKMRGPATLEHRYLTEDLVYGIVPLVKLGKRLGLHLPCLNLTVDAFSELLGRDLLGAGPDIAGIALPATV